MIVPMKKVFMIVQKKDFVPSLEEMRALGVVHVEHNDVLKSDDITAIKDDIQLLEQVIRILENAKTDDHAPKEALDSVFEWREVTECVLHQMKKIEVLSDNILKRQGLINKLQKWGNFEPQDISHLKEKGINVSFCEIPVSQKIVPKEGVIVEVLSRTGGINNCMVITTGSVDPGHEGIVLPAKSLSHEHDSQEKEKNNIKRAEDELKAQVKYLPALKRKLREKEEKLVFKEVIVGAKNTGELTLLKGYCPQKTCSQIETKAKEHQWGILFEDPSEEDKVPTLLENPKWVSVINPLINFIGILPGYKEVDINPFLLLFFSLFVGILVGDAGYGFIYLLTCAIAHFAMRKKVKDITFFKLIYLLCGCIIVWGVFTGTYFGQEWLGSSVKPVIPWLVDPKNLQTLCFLVGAIHLSIAHCWRMILFYPSLVILSEAGWIFLVWGMYFAARMFILDVAFPGAGIILFILGPLLVYLFSEVTPLKKYLQTVSGQLFPKTLDIIGVFSDIVSYIRLYAVGLATVAIADAANRMSISWIIILHAINILLAALAILVHALRLNTLEFSRHLGLEWTGFTYDPFRKTENIN